LTDYKESKEMTVELLQSAISKVPINIFELHSNPSARKNLRINEALTMSSLLLWRQRDYGKKTCIPLHSTFTDMGEIKGKKCVKVELYGQPSETMPLTGSFEFRGWIESKEEEYFLVRPDDKESANEQV